LKITLPDEGICGIVIIPEGEYWVAPQLEAGQINLVGGGRDYPLKAVRRRQSAKCKTLNIAFSCGGGTTWSLVVQSPKHGEWAAFIEIKKARKNNK